MRGYANQKRPSPLEGAGWEGHRQGAPRLLERIFPDAESQALASEAGGPGQGSWEPPYPQPQDRIWAEQGPVNTCYGLEAFPRDETLTEAMSLTHTGGKAMPACRPSGQNTSPSRTCLEGEVFSCRGQGACLRPPATSGTDDWTAARPALPLNKASDNTSPKQPRS